MAQFTTTANLLDSILSKAGETTNGNSPFEAKALEYLNRIHHAIIAGGTEFNIEVNEVWSWARQKHPIVLELQPAYSTGTVSFTQGNASGTFSSGPTASLEGWHLRVDGKDEVFKIIQHTAGATAFETDSAYTDTTTTGSTFKAFKLDYELLPSYLYIDSTNNKIDFEETSSTELTATLTSGSYTPSELATEIKTQLDSAGASTYTVTYSSLTRKFTIVSDGLGGGGVFNILLSTGTNIAINTSDVLGLNDTDKTGALTYSSDIEIGRISHIVEPIQIHKGAYGMGNIYGMDFLTMQKRYPLTGVKEGFPNYFSVIEETVDGKMTVRFDRYVDEKTRVLVGWVEIPKDLVDTAASIPLIPRKYSDVLEYGAASYILIEKEDNKWELYAKLAGQKLQAMLQNNRQTLERVGNNFGNVVPRSDLILNSRRNLIYGEPLDQ